MKKPCYFAVLSAALIACALPAAAPAEGSVTLYGVVDAGLRAERISITGQGGASHVGLAPNGSLPSRFGLRGRSPVGGAWEALFQIENGFNPVDGRTGERLFGRDSFVGLGRAGLGSIRVGRLSNISDDYIGLIDPLAESYGIAGADTVLSNSLRTDNTIMVASDPIGGFSTAASYSFDVDSVRDERFASPLRTHALGDQSRLFSAGMKYADGAFALMGSYDRYMPGNAIADAQGQGSRQISALLMGAVYQFDAVKLSVAFGRTMGGWLSGKGLGFLPATRTGANANDTVPTVVRRQLGSYSPAAGFHADSSVLGLVIPAGSGEILTSWQRASASNRRLTGGDSIFNVYSLAYRYDLSKRSALYAFGSYATHYAFLPDVTATQFGVGMRHSF